MVTSIAYPHDAPVELMPDVFFVHGRMRMGPGMSINRNMVVVRNGSDLTLINPIRLTPDGEKALEQYGNVRHAVRLGPFHGVDDAYTVERFGAQFWSLGAQDDYPAPEPHRVLAEGEELPIPDARLFVFRETTRPECCLLLERGGGLLVSLRLDPALGVGLELLTAGQGRHLRDGLRASGEHRSAVEEDDDEARRLAAA